MSSAPPGTSTMPSGQARHVVLATEHNAPLLHVVPQQGSPTPPHVSQLPVPSQAALDAYMVDPRRTALAAERDAAVARTDIHRVELV